MGKLNKLLFIAMLVLCSVSVFADYTDNIIFTANFSENPAGQTTKYGANFSVINGTLNTGSMTSTPMEYGDGLNRTSASQYSNSAGTTVTFHAFTACFDIEKHTNAGTSNAFIFSTSDGTPFITLSVYQDSHASAGIPRFQYRTDAGDEIGLNGGSAMNNSEVTLCFVRNYDDSRSQIYINGVSILNSTTHFTGAISITSSDFFIGNTARSFIGGYDVMTLWDKGLNGQEVLDFSTRVEGGAPPPAAPTVNETIERTTDVEQAAPVTINNKNYQLVSSGIIVLGNATNISLTTSLNAVALTRDGTLFCRVGFDGVYYNTTYNRSMSLNKYGSMYIASSVFSVTPGTYTASLECARDVGSNNNIEISTSHIVVHQLIDATTAEPLNYVSASLSETITSATYTKVWAYNFTTSAGIVDSDIKKHIVVDGALQYNYVSTGEISTYWVINGSTFGEYPRYGVAGSVGSVGSLFYEIPNPSINTSQEISLEIWAKSTTLDGSFSGSATVKEFIIYEHEQNKTLLNGSIITSATYVDAYNMSVNNQYHAGGNLVIKASIPMKATVNTARATFRLKVNGVTGEDIIRDISGINQNGVLIIQDNFNIPTGINNITLQGKTNSSITITGGDFVAYITEKVEFIPQSFNVTAYNFWNGSLIHNFNVTNIAGTTFTTTTGTVQVFGNTTIENLTLTDGVYLPRTINNHNTSTTLNTTLWENEVYVNGFSLFSGIQINDSNVTLGTNFSVSNDTGYTSFYPNEGTYTLTMVAPGYWPQSYSVTYTTLTYNNFTFNMTDFKLNVTALSYGTPINNFNVEITRLTPDYTQEEDKNTTTGTAEFDIIAGQYNISIVADGYAFDYEIVTFNASNTFHQLNFSLLQTNTFNLSFYDEVYKTLIDDSNIVFELISASYAANHTTTNGTLLLPLLTPEAYTLRYVGTPDYPQRFNYFQLSNGSFNDIKLYLLNTSQNTDVTATVYDENNVVVEDAQIKTLRYDISTNSYILQEIVITNFEGQAVMGLQLDTEYYKFIIDYQGVQKLETSPTYISETSLTFGIVKASLAGEDYFIYEKVTSDVYFNNNTENFVFTYNDASNTATQGCLYVYEVLVTSDTLINSSCSSTAAASIVLGITPENNSVYRADGYVTIDGDARYFGSAHADYTGEHPLQTQADALGLWLLMILFMFSGIFNLTLALLLTPAPLFLGALLGMLNIPLWAASGIYVLALILAIVVSQRN